MAKSSAFQAKVNIGLLILVIALMVSACNSSSVPVSSASNLEELSSHYKQYHDYQSLVMLIPYLQSDMTRSDVEKLLGKPSCINPSQCYYSSDQHTRLNCPYSRDAYIPKKCIPPSGYEVSTQGPPITLVIEYDLANPTNATLLPSESNLDLLWSYVLMPIGE
jgi:hypothetical protein